MTPLDFSNVELKHLVTHHVGNASGDEKILLSSGESLVMPGTSEFLLKYFLQSFRAEEFFSFSVAPDTEPNEVYAAVKEIFAKPKSITKLSQSIARLLYEKSVHPRMKEGELSIAYFSDVVVIDEVFDAVGIFKSETTVPYLKMKNQESHFSIHHDDGFELKGIDKACIIFNTEEDSGYRILTIDNSSKAEDGQLWKEEFLQLQPLADGYHQTTQFLGVAKDFITKQLPAESELSKTDKIGLLNRSVDYFKNRENFNKAEFEKEVFQDAGIIKSFRKFDASQREESGRKSNEDFEISPEAVKKQARVFKSVLKLDKNFHIYIHGNQNMIERGVEKDGRKFYKIYYKDES